MHAYVPYTQLLLTVALYLKTVQCSLHALQAYKLLGNNYLVTID